MTRLTNLETIKEEQQCDLFNSLLLDDVKQDLSYRSSCNDDYDGQLD